MSCKMYLGELFEKHIIEIDRRLDEEWIALKTSPYANRTKLYSNRLFLVFTYKSNSIQYIIGPKCIEQQRLDPINIRCVRTAARLL